MRGIVKEAQKKRLTDLIRERLVTGKGTNALGQPFQNRVIGGESKLMEFLGKPGKKGWSAWSPAVWASKAPVDWAGNIGKNVMFGRPGTLGKYRGTRLRPIAGGPGKGLEEISKAEFNAIKAGKLKGEAVKGAIGGKQLFYKRKFRPGGLTGFAMKHPLISAGGLLAAIALMRSPKAREFASGINPVKAPENTVSPITAKQWQGYGPSGNTLKSNVWG
jgi:hypothetical protein